MIKLSHLFITEPLNILINSALWGYCTLVCSLRDKSQRQTRLLNNDLMNSRYRDRNCSYLETQINFLPQISCENLFYSLFEQCFSIRGDFAPLPRPRKHLVMSAELFGCHNWVGDVLTSCGGRPGFVLPQDSPHHPLHDREVSGPE